MDSESRRATGSYYTAADTADFMADWLISDKHLKVLEPTAGDGIFIEALIKAAKSSKLKLEITAVELEKEAFDAINIRQGVQAFHTDFHLFDCPPVDAAIGNPPFVRFRHLSKEHLTAAENAGRQLIGKELDISGSIWLSIILHASKSIKPNGKIAFVIPSDSVYVRYAKPFWTFLCNNFENIRIVRCKERLFPEILQDVVLLFAESAGKSTSTIVCEDYQTFDDVRHGRTIGVNTISLNEIIAGEKPFMKAHLTSGDRLWLEEIKLNCQKAIEYAKFNIGYVSGNKKFFHPNEEVIEAFSLPEKSLRSSVVTARKLSNAGYSTSELAIGLERVWLPNPENLSAGEKKYIDFGERLGVNSGHKTGRRNPWFAIPGVVIPDVMLTVFGELPRLLINDASLPASNSILIGRFKSPFPTDEFLMLWYSSITRIGIELAVHSLGGGVLVLVPREGDSVLMPKPIGKCVPELLLEKLRKCLVNNDLQSAYEVGDEYLLSAGWDEKDISRAKILANQLMLRRKK